jgi:hypothetical protein
MITQEMLHKLFRYENGILYWKTKHSKKVLIGNMAGGLKPNGYVQVRINNKKYLAHRLIFLMHHGYVPDVLDHIDCNPSNNKIENLRPATSSTNLMNRRKQRNNSSGIKNVHWSKKYNKWVVRIGLNKKVIHICYCQDIELAELASIEARNLFHKEFAQHG